ncbi:MAG: 4-hydroxy-tetrahydrodipicolinate reductase [Spirochaetales bacterium]|nr:4-hydroxy-tetrahydrodipicolinate reductase [Spirochaetales bacterium]
MKVIIVGYGRMGKEVEAICAQRKHTIVAKVDPVCGDAPALTKELADQADVAIEFALPESAYDNVKLYTELDLPAVCGTTGWYDRVDEFRNLVTQSSIGYLYGSNFSIGAHLFFKLVARAAQLINPFPEYDIMGFEAHHNRKKDSPSGTALSIANIILENVERKKTILTDKCDHSINESELHFASLRGGHIPGIHKVIIDSEADTIEVSHSARNRGGLALGAVLASEWLKDKKGFFNIDDFISERLKYTQMI